MEQMQIAGEEEAMKLEHKLGYIALIAISRRWLACLVRFTE